MAHLHLMYRVATREETHFYQTILYPLQDHILGLTATFEDLYLTGGTALARFYLQHRFSDDLDLFIQVRSDDDLDTHRRRKRADAYAQDLVSLLSKDFTICDELYDFYSSRFFILTDTYRFKVDIVREHLHYGELTHTPQGWLLNNIEDMAAAKIAAFEDRAEIKDILDLWYLSRQTPLSRMFELADLKRVPVAYEHLLTIHTQGISGMALLCQPIDEAELAQFVEELKHATQAEIKKKEQDAREHIQQIIVKLLWDFPRERRDINPFSIPVLKRRLNQLKLPERRALQKVLG